MVDYLSPEHRQMGVKTIKILLLDIETAPNLVHVWGLWQQNVGINQIIDSGYVMCWAAKWYGETDIYFDSIHQSSSKAMLKRIHKMIDAADAVIHYNGAKFDIPTLQKEFLLHGLLPPSPIKQIDLLKTARSQFRFPSNKLDYIAQSLGLGKKSSHSGHQLWIDCMNKDPTAWEAMKEYNINDVVLLEAVYEKLKPWIKNHPNVAVHDDLVLACPTCSSYGYQRRGVAITKAGKYPRYRCNSCGSWFRGTRNEGMKPEERFTNG